MKSNLDNANLELEKYRFVVTKLQDDINEEGENVSSTKVLSICNNFIN